MQTNIFWRVIAEDEQEIQTIQENIKKYNLDVFLYTTGLHMTLYKLESKGGAIYIENSNNTIINTNLLQENKANAGGSLYITNSKKITINNTIFTKNNAYSQKNVEKNSQGILFTKNTTTIIENTTFNENYGDSILFIENSKTKINTTIFTKNSASSGSIQNLKIIIIMVKHIVK